MADQPPTPAYCGAPPLPGGATWNLDPLLLAALLAGLALAWGPAGRGGGRRALLAGWALLAGALVSPLCSLSVALFSARVGQHLLVVLGAAPLLAVGLRAPRAWASPGSLAAAAALFAIVLWA